MLLAADYDHLYAGTEQLYFKLSIESVLVNMHQLVAISHCAKALQWKKFPMQVQISHIIVRSNQLKN